MKNISRIGFFVLLVFLQANLSFAQFEIPEKPELQTSVYDYVDVLNSIEEQNLREKLIRYSDTTSTQIVIATISSTEGENIMYLGAQWAHAWGIGQENEDNGVFILLARDDRKIAINTGYGVEHLLTDAMSRRIIERDIIPYFKQNDYYGGLNRGADAIFEILQGEYQTEPIRRSSQGPPIGLIIFLIVLFIIFVIAISKSKKGGGGRGFRDPETTRDILEAIILSRAGRGGYRKSSGGFGGIGGSSDGSSSGGGFGGGFGGGGFGGGGASGGW
ncbi:MAG: TPM domain-containing protein [Bacteroidia bacterium]|nr:TPM domain-containing protein [Bacteroidia bacterium]NNK70846.1 TPM domain-containing protein [Flavobacteriaceae bacterium]